TEARPASRLPRAARCSASGEGRSVELLRELFVDLDDHSVDDRLVDLGALMRRSEELRDERMNALARDVVAVGRRLHLGRAEDLLEKSALSCLGACCGSCRLVCFGHDQPPSFSSPRPSSFMSCSRVALSPLPNRAVRRNAFRLAKSVVSRPTASR